MRKYNWGKIIINKEEFNLVSSKWSIIKIKNLDYFEIQGSGIDKFEGTKEYLSTESISGIELINIEEVITFDKRPARANLQPKTKTIYFARMKDTLKVISPDENFCKKYILSTGFAGLKTKKIHLRFVKYIALSHLFISKKDGFSMGTTQEAINNRWIKEISLPLPPPEEQIVISDFLDDNTHEIDKIIKNKKKQIGLLKELREVQTNNALCLKLCKENKLTSDIEWTSQLPSPWQVTKLKKCLENPLSNGIFKKKEFFGRGTLLINVFDIYQSLIIDETKLERVEISDAELNKFRVKENEIFMTRSSLKEEGVGACTIVKNLTEPVVYECHLIKITPDSSIINPLYLLYYLHYFANDMLVSLSNTVTMTTLSQPKLKDLKIILPKIEVQKEIITSLENYNSKISELCKKLNSEISKLEEYKKILINDAVTGKMKVIA